MPKRGDVVVFKTPTDNRTDYIKRVIGLPGDTIRIIDGQIQINGNLVLKKITKPFIDNTNYENKRKRQYLEYFFDKEILVLDLRDLGLNSSDNTELITVKEGYIFVMGDNRDNSADSRVIGQIPIKNLVGKVIYDFKRFFNRRPTLDDPESKSFVII